MDKIIAYIKLDRMNDKQKLIFLMENKELDYTVYLDNDLTIISLNDEDIETIYLDNYLGSSKGIKILLEMLGIKYDYV